MLYADATGIHSVDLTTSEHHLVSASYDWRFLAGRQYGSPDRGLGTSATPDLGMALTVDLPGPKVVVRQRCVA